jgi:hypothetical protein
MKVKTSITLTEELLKVVDKRAKKYHKNRSEHLRPCAMIRRRPTKFAPTPPVPRPALLRVAACDVTQPGANPARPAT